MESNGMLDIALTQSFNINNALILILGGRKFESRRVRTDMACWLATSLLNSGTDCLPARRLALAT